MHSCIRATYTFSANRWVIIRQGILAYSSVSRYKKHNLLKINVFSKAGGVRRQQGVVLIYLSVSSDENIHKSV